MSSLLQSRGRISHGKVELFMYLVKKGKDWDQYNGPNSYQPSPYSTSFCDDVEPLVLKRPDGTQTTVSKLYRIWRKPCGMMGCWVQFRYNGEVHVPDLSVPIQVFNLPRDAEALTDEECASHWFSE